MIIYLELEGDKVFGYGSMRTNPANIEIEVADSHPILFNPSGWKYVDGELFKDEEGHTIELLRIAKEHKESELNQDCNQAILRGFQHEINGEKFWFSYDMEAQMNFERVRKDFQQGIVTEQAWTAKNESGEYVRILIDYALMIELSILASKHIDKKVDKFRDYYMTLVMNAESIEEVEAIQWESEDEAMSKEELEAEIERYNNTPTVEQLKAENSGLKEAILELTDLIFLEM